MAPGPAQHNPQKHGVEQDASFSHGLAAKGKKAGRQPDPGEKKIGRAFATVGRPKFRANRPFFGLKFIIMVFLQHSFVLRLCWSALLWARTVQGHHTFFKQSSTTSRLGSQVHSRHSLRASSFPHRSRRCCSSSSCRQTPGDDDGRSTISAQARPLIEAQEGQQVGVPVEVGEATQPAQVVFEPPSAALEKGGVVVGRPRLELLGRERRQGGGEVVAVEEAADLNVAGRGMYMCVESGQVRVEWHLSIHPSTQSVCQPHRPTHY